MPHSNVHAYPKQLKDASERITIGQPNEVCSSVLFYQQSRIRIGTFACPEVNQGLFNFQNMNLSTVRRPTL